MRKIIKALIYLDTDEGEKMDELVRDVKSILLGMNNLYTIHGLGSIKVTTTGFDYAKDCANGGWGLEMLVSRRELRGSMLISEVEKET